jgi:hypothetical protein
MHTTRRARDMRTTCAPHAHARYALPGLAPRSLRSRYAPATPSNTTGGWSDLQIHTHPPELLRISSRVHKSASEAKKVHKSFGKSKKNTTFVGDKSPIKKSTIMKKPKKPIICQLDVSELNWYAHDYELPAEAEVHLHAAHKLLADGHPGEALEEIAEARAKLTKYLSQDNMILEDDTANPWVRFGDILNNLDLVIL